MERINIGEKFASFTERWQPKILAELNGQEVKLVKRKGRFHGITTTTWRRCFWSGAAVFASSSEIGSLSLDRAKWSSFRAA